jgi:hypothetical protein
LNKFACRALCALQANLFDKAYYLWYIHERNRPAARAAAGFNKALVSRSPARRAKRALSNEA